MRASGQAIHLPIQWESEQARQKVERFLESNPFLFPLLGETVEKIGVYFGHPQLILEVVDDPKGGFPQLVLTIDTDLSAEEAVARLEQFHQEWWLENLQRSEFKLVIAINYP